MYDIRICGPLFFGVGLYDSSSTGSDIINCAFSSYVTCIHYSTSSTVHSHTGSKLSHWATALLLSSLINPSHLTNLKTITFFV